MRLAASRARTRHAIRLFLGVLVLAVPNGTTLVSVSHRPATLQYHEQVLELRGNGEFRIYRAASYVFNQEFATE